MNNKQNSLIVKIMRQMDKKESTFDDFQGRFKDHAIISEDKRIKIKNTSNHPYDCIGLIIGQYENEEHTNSWSTGFLIESNIVLTVAHFLLEAKTSNMLKNITFYSGLNGKTNQVKTSSKVKVVKYSEKYQKYKSKQDSILYDYAFLILETQIKLTKYLTLHSDFNNFQQKIFNSAFIVGYPQQYMIYQNLTNFSGVQYEEHGTIKLYEKQNIKYIEHMISTTFGQAGSPILLQKNNKFYVIGIHKGSRPEGKKQVNVGVLISPQFIKQLQLWKSQCGLEKIILNFQNKGEKVQLKEGQMKKLHSEKQKRPYQIKEQKKIVEEEELLKGQKQLQKLQEEELAAILLEISLKEQHQQKQKMMKEEDEMAEIIRRIVISEEQQRRQKERREEEIRLKKIEEQKKEEQNRLKKIEEQKKVEESRIRNSMKQCIVCFERPREMIGGCFHISICMKCSESLKSCPICTKETAWNRIYIP